MQGLGVLGALGVLPQGGGSSGELWAERGALHTLGSPP